MIDSVEYFSLVSSLEDLAMRYKSLLQSSLDDLEQNYYSEKGCDAERGCSVRILKREGSFQYYIRKRGENNGRFVPKKDWKFVSAIIQREYISSLRKRFTDQSKLLTSLLNSLETENAEKLFYEMPEGKRRLISPEIESLENFIQRWLSKPYEKLVLKETETEYVASNGVQVRSKSELIIAETLIRNNVPFRYEPALRLRQGRTSQTVHPDFLCLNKRTLVEYMWEHFGLVGETSYAENMVKKMKLYSNEGFVLGCNFLATFETLQTPLSPMMVDSLVNKFLL